LIDDNLDYVSHKSGKKIGIDLQEGKITLPLIFTLKNCGPAEKALIEETVNAQPITRKAFFRVFEVIERYQGVQYTHEKAKEYVKKAKGHLHLFPNSREKEALCTLADYVLERKL
jgi:octaprenyl-diphosphate synthase